MNTIKFVILGLFAMNCTAVNNVVPSFFESQEVRWNDDDKVFIFFRHAEKEVGTDPQLTEQGKERAEKLLNIFSKHKPSKVFSSETRRTKETVKFVSDKWNLPIEIYNPSLIDETASFFRSQAPGVYLISGHSNSTPNLANAICDCEVFPAIDESDYSNIFVVVIKDNKITTHQLQY